MPILSPAISCRRWLGSKPRFPRRGPHIYLGMVLAGRALMRTAVRQLQLTARGYYRAPFNRVAPLCQQVITPCNQESTQPYPPRAVNAKVVADLPTSGMAVRIWWEMIRIVPDAGGCRIEVYRIETGDEVYEIEPLKQVAISRFVLQNSQKNPGAPPVPRDSYSPIESSMFLAQKQVTDCYRHNPCDDRLDTEWEHVLSGHIS